jgi:5-formyltetrahydrofolate cyclo-ligase
MEEVQAKKNEIREEIENKLNQLSETQRAEKKSNIEANLFGFANFIEAKIALLYVAHPGEVDTNRIIEQSIKQGKIIVLPAFRSEKRTVPLLKVTNMETDLKPGPRGVLEPVSGQCKPVPIDCIDIAIIPGAAFDEKGGRIGSGRGYYDRLIPKLPITTRKVSLAFEEQILPVVPMDSHDKYVDIIITDQRTIYKI